LKQLVSVWGRIGAVIEQGQIFRVSIDPAAPPPGRPEKSIAAMPAALLDRAAMLTQGTEVCLDAEIEVACRS